MKHKVFRCSALEDVEVFDGLVFLGGDALIAPLADIVGLRISRVRTITRRLERLNLISSYYTMISGVRHIHYKVNPEYSMVYVEPEVKEPVSKTAERVNDLCRALACAGAGIPC